MRLKLLLFFLFSSGLAAAQLPQINGFVVDAQTGEALQGAIVTDSSGLVSTYTNREGFYNLGVSSGKHLIIITASGYQRNRMVLDIYNNTAYNVEMMRLSEFKNDSHSNVQHTVYDVRSGHVAPLASQVSNMPALLSEPDPVKFLQYLPGVNGGIEGLAGMYVRGGNADQNLITMDGLPIYGNGHLFGFLSNFNPGQVRDVQFYRGVMPARYGGRAGSAMDVSMLEGSRGDAHGSFESDLLTLKFNLNGALNRSGTTTGSFGMRRSWIDLFLPKGGNNFILYNLHDINAKVVFRPGNNDKVSVWFYNGRDKFRSKFSETDTDSLNRSSELSISTGVTWQNTLAGINYTHRFNNRLYSNFLLGMTRYAYSSPFGLEATITTDTSSSNAKLEVKNSVSITDFIAKGNFEYGISSTKFLRFGAEVINHTFRPSLRYFNLKSNNNTRLDTTYGSVNVQNAQEASAYGELELSTSGGLKMNLGGRVWMFSGKDKTFVRPEPRLLVSQMLEGGKALKFGFAIANQGIHQLSNVNANLPNDVWFPTSGNFKPQQNIQITGGFYQPWRAGIEFSADLYYKWMNGITDIKSNDENELDVNYWEKMVAQGKGTAYGSEIVAMKKTGRLNGLVGYGYSLSNRTIADINGGVAFPFRWDRRHKFSLQGVYRVNKSLMLNFALVVMSGNAVTVPTGRYVTADGSFVYDYSDKNNYRMPLYKRVDFGFKKQIHPDPRVYEKQYWGMNIYNILAFKNPVFVSVGEDSNGVFGARGISFFNFIPSIFYKWEF